MISNRFEFCIEDILQMLVSPNLVHKHVFIHYMIRMNKSIKPICILHMPISMWFSYYCIPGRLNITLYNHNSGERTYFYDINFSFSCSCHQFYIVDFLKEEGRALKCNSMAKKIFE